VTFTVGAFIAARGVTRNECKGEHKVSTKH
jgi:hypothetical protein